MGFSSELAHVSARYSDGNGLAALLMGFSDPEAEIEKARWTTDADAQDPPFCAIMTLIVPLRGTSRSRYTQI